MKKEEILGIKVSIINYETLINNIKMNIIDKNKKSIIAINPEKIIKALKNKELKKILNKTDYAIADGIGIVLASKLKRGEIKSRITGIDCMEMICDKTRDIGAKIFLYGSKPGVALNVKQKLEKKYKGIKIVGILDGYQKDKDTIIKEINKSKANILFVALGSPKQEYFIFENKDKLNVNIMQGVGGSFDVICGNIKRAPKWMQKLGLEWLYRLLKEPSRIWRQLNLIKFLFIVISSRNKKTIRR